MPTPLLLKTKKDIPNYYHYLGNRKLSVPYMLRAGTMLVAPPVARIMEEDYQYLYEIGKGSLLSGYNASYVYWAVPRLMLFTYPFDLCLRDKNIDRLSKRKPLRDPNAWYNTTMPLFVEDLEILTDYKLVKDDEQYKYLDGYQKLAKEGDGKSLTEITAQQGILQQACREYAADQLGQIIAKRLAGHHNWGGSFLGSGKSILERVARSTLSE